MPNLSGGSSPNNARPSFGHNRNVFPMDHHEFLTAKFGDVTPFFSFNAEPGDTVPLRSAHDIQSYTLKSPLMSSFMMFKTYFHVPMSAILPRTWELIYTNPVQGSDVPSDAICATNQIGTLINNLCALSAGVTNGSLTYGVSQRLSALLLLEQLLSYGGLPQLMRRNLRVFIQSIDSRNSITDPWISSPALGDPSLGSKVNSFFNSMYGVLYNDFSTGFANMGVYEGQSRLIYQPKSNSRSEFRYCISLIRENADYHFFDYDQYPSPSLSSFDTWCGKHKMTGSTSITESFNYARLVAYQLSCAEFISNEYVDSVYTSLLYRDNAEGLFITYSGSLRTFSYNGRSIVYDAFSGNSFNRMVSLLGSAPSFSNGIIKWFQLLFGLKRSLKRVDYFTSSKSQPLAVGNVNAPVVASNVSAVDITHSIQMQRFLNAVNKTGRKFSEYIKGLFGEDIKTDRHEPHFIASQPFNISGFEVEQTTPAAAGSTTDLGSRVTILKSSADNYEFSVDIDEPTIIVGVLHFELSRAYADASDRQTYHLDRFDMFNPFMQFIGDQPIFKSELGIVPSANEDPFGYQIRYNEYKKSFDHASGAFCDDVLPSYATVESSGANYVGQIPPTVINSEYIRSNSAEMDRFYSSLSYLSLTDYFHFIISIQNNVNSVRSMEFKPNIL